MKFPAQCPDFAANWMPRPFAIVFSCLLLFFAFKHADLHAGRVSANACRVRVPGTDKPTIAVAMDKNGRFYFDNQRLDERDLKSRLQQAARSPAAARVGWFRPTKQ